LINHSWWRNEQGEGLVFMKKNEEKVFLIFNATFIGDILVTNILCQNIKRFYPDSKVVFIVQPQFIDVAKYQKDVDEVFGFDKKNDGGFCGVMNFIKNFPYKRPFASFITYESDRNLFISKLLGSKHVISQTQKGLKFLHSKEKFGMHPYSQMKDIFASLLEPLVEKVETNLPIVYNPPKSNSDIVKSLEEKSRENDLVLICPTSKSAKKDITPQMAVNLIGKINADGKIPALTGAGEASRSFLQSVKDLGCSDFIDLIGKTSFVELANIIKFSKGVISVDTGTMHFANALQVPVLALFYYGYEEHWAPDESLYPAKTLSNESSVDIIYNEFLNLVNSESLSLTIK